MKNQKGITLIALVVTIVVLLILAGITIVYVLQDGSIFQTAKQAGEDTTARSVEEYASQMQIRAYAVYYAQGKNLQVVAKDGKTAAEEADTKHEYVTTEITDFMPDLEGKMQVTGSITNLKSENGIMGGSFEVTANNKNYTVTFDKGVATATLKKN